MELRLSCTIPSICQLGAYWCHITTKTWVKTSSGNQWLPIDNGLPWHSTEINITVTAPDINYYNEFEKYTCKITSTYPRAMELKQPSGHSRQNIHRFNSTICNHTWTNAIYWPFGNKLSENSNQNTIFLKEMQLQNVLFRPWLFKIVNEENKSWDFEVLLTDHIIVSILRIG